MRNEMFMRKRLAWRTALLDANGHTTIAGDVILRDLIKFCRGLETTAQFSPITGQVDAIASAKADGRREVLLRIYRFLYGKEPSPQQMQAMVQQQE